MYGRWRGGADGGEEQTEKKSRRTGRAYGGEEQTKGNSRRRGRADGKDQQTHVSDMMDYLSLSMMVLIR